MVIPVLSSISKGAEMVIPVLSRISLAIMSLYGIVGKIDDYLDEHIDKMKQSENQTISRTGNVLEAAKCGFGIGYITSVIIIATGQVILGNPLLGAGGTLLSAATFINPIAMTCAAVGAIIYGWAALSQAEQAEIIEKLTKGLEVGAELIKSVLIFLISKTKELMNSKNVAEFKKYIKEYASEFGKSLHEITHGFADFVKDAAEATTTAVGKAYEKTAEGASTAAEATSSVLIEAFETTSDAASSVRKATAKASKRAYVKTVRVASKLTSSNKKLASPTEMDVLPKTESAAARSASKTLKVVAAYAGPGRDAVKTTSKVIQSSSKKSVAAAGKLLSAPKKTVARKVNAKVSLGNVKLSRPAAI